MMSSRGKKSGKRAAISQRENTDPAKKSFMTDWISKVVTETQLLADSKLIQASSSEQDRPSLAQIRSPQVLRPQCFPSTQVDDISPEDFENLFDDRGFLCTPRDSDREPVIPQYSARLAYEALVADVPPLPAKQSQ
jgi:hypothetical protein